MRFKLIICVMLCLVFQRGYATKILDIRAEDYQTSVCRLVLDLDSAVSVEIKQSSNEWQINIPGFDGNLPVYSHGSKMIKAIGTVSGGISIKTVAGLRVETMSLSSSKQAVIDFFISPTDKAEHMAIARFYSDKGKYGTADEMFYAIAQEYGTEDDVQYYWGLLLMRRGSTRAKAKLMAIAESSKYHEPAQKLLGMSSRYRLPEDLPADPILEPVKESPAQPDSVYIAPVVMRQKVSAPKTCPNFLYILSKLYYSPIWFLVIVLGGFALYRYFPKRKKAEKQEEIEESSLSIDPDTLGRMVGRLMADGWTTKEIAREMKISVREVEQLANRQRHFSFRGGSDDKK